MNVGKRGSSMVDEMSIVDVLTRLIFDAEVKLSDSEQMVLDQLEHVDESLLGASRRDISEYLRSMGVDEMIRVVKRIKQLIDRRQGLIAAPSHNGNHAFHH